MTVRCADVAGSTYTHDVFISYQWDYQRLVIQIVNRLVNDGITVWFDMNNMCTLRFHMHVEYA